MRRLLLLPLLVLFFGCVQNHFNVPEQNFADRVKVLGVAPIIVDVESDIKHPQKEQLIALVAEMNRKYEPQFVRKLKESGNFYSVSALYGEPRDIFSSLLFRHEKRNDASVDYNKYFWKNDELRGLIQRNRLDAVMLIVVSGLSKTEKISSSTLMTSLTSEYNYLNMTAQILDANGTVLWEYPNFRDRFITYNPMINLQYPDFSEAEANVFEKPEVKFKTIEGIKRAFEIKRKDLLRRDTQDSEVYSSQFDEMISVLKFEPAKGRKAPAETVTSPASAEQPQPQPQSLPAPAPAPEPVVEPTKTQEEPAGADKPLAGDAVAPLSDEIVPANGSKE